MGQGRSRNAIYISPEVQQQPIRKAGSLTSLSFGRMSRKGSSSSLKRARSFKEEREAQQEELRAKIESEAKEMDKWVNDLPRKCRQFVVPKLTELSSNAVSKCLLTPMDVERLPVNRELKEAIEFRLSPAFDQEIIDKKMSITNGGRSIMYTGKGYSTSIMRTPFQSGFSNGRHAWILHIDSSRIQGWIQIGVVDEKRFKSKCKTVWDGNPHPFRSGEMARRNNGNFHSGKSELEATMVQETIYLGGYGIEDTIGVQVDFDTRQIQWLKNGEAYGGRVSFEEDQCPLHPSVSLDSPGEGVTLAYYTGSLAL